MTKFYVYFIEHDFVNFRTQFESKIEAIQYVKDELKGTDGSFALQIIGFNNGAPVYSKTYTAENHKAKAI